MLYNSDIKSCVVIDRSIAMQNKIRDVDIDLISCEVCLQSIPKEEAESVETDEYVAYFCGLDCYDLWVRQNEGKNKMEKV